MDNWIQFWPVRLDTLVTLGGALYFIYRAARRWFEKRHAENVKAINEIKTEVQAVKLTQANLNHQLEASARNSDKLEKEFTNFREAVAAQYGELKGSIDTMGKIFDRITLKN
jgi:hypothetical protein